MSGMLDGDGGRGVTRREAVGVGSGLAVGAALAGAPGAAAARRGHESVSIRSVSLEQAQKVLKAAKREAERIGVAMFMIVVDAAGVEKASLRMDGNGQASPTLAPLKAQTANGFRTPTHVLASNNANDPARIASITAAGFSLLGGGAPLRDGSTVIGAIGVGGGSAAQDVQVAEAGAAALA
jgi:uncharacterized protein GlcG (DUF336 family)